MDQAKALSFKFIVIGETRVGKTCLTKRLINSDADFEDIEGDTFQTVSVDVFEKKIDINNETIRLEIWDTAGQEKYGAIAKQYYREAKGILVVFAIDDHKTFERAKEFYAGVENQCDTDQIRVILVGNKVDLIDKRQVTYEEASGYANSINVDYIETSAKNNTNVAEAFEKIARQIYTLYKENNVVVNNKIDDQATVDLKQENEKEKKRECC
ncbi:small GTP-binding protein [Histomonas meleagridis]|uniref:small GTP-binding protein n=1 Tax=Histomonas meleagridis TaxID=135588 RepID=UPI0035596562|nr:small GTP-binding protein [Histomonas meleagridis]KAH0799465.1 small GTP-binding protein [Histomonas meleagridis]